MDSVPSDQPKKRKGTMKQSNVLYPKSLLDRADEAAAWEGLTKASYYRSALMARVRKTEGERKKEEDETK